MGQDMVKGRRTEIEFMNGLVVEKGRELGIPTPANAVLTDIVKKVERGALKPDKSHITDCGRAAEAHANFRVVPAKRGPVPQGRSASRLATLDPSAGMTIEETTERITMKELMPAAEKVAAKLFEKKHTIAVAEVLRRRIDLGGAAGRARRLAILHGRRCGLHPTCAAQPAGAGRPARLACAHRPSLTC